MRHPGALLLSIYGLYFLAVITPGANTFIIMRLALAGSRAQAGRAVLGIVTGNAIWLGVTLGGVAVLLQRAPGGLQSVRWIGGVYLVFMGLRGLWPSKRTPSATVVGSADAGRPYNSGLLASLWNPNTLPFYLSILAPAVMPDVPLWVRIASGAGIRREPLVRTALSCVLLAYGLRMLVLG
jgi:threonine/homoserine/homoserine lactone efflux protein